MRTLDRLLDGVRDPSRPLITYYDMASGERVELSATTTANWVAKTSNFLVDDLHAAPGTRVRIGLPSHWLTMVWILSAWRVGAAVVDAAADIGVSGPELLADEPIRVASSMRPWGARFSPPPPGFADVGAEVPGQPDDFVALDPPEPLTLAIDLGDNQHTHADVLGDHGADPIRRLVEPGTLARDVALLVRACRGGGSVVIVASATAADIAGVAAQEAAVIG